MSLTEDLQWWLDLAPQLDWTFARSMPDYPHSYVVRDKTLHDPEFLRAVRVIRTFGEPGKFYNRTNIYLTSPDGKTKWWTMGDTLDGTIIINQADTSVDYGTQDAPRTYSGHRSVYDDLACFYDSRYDRPECHAENKAVRRLIVEHFGAYAPTVLDVGCGTGLVLDLGITAPALYTGLDPSQGMLNELVRKHPKVDHLIPATMEEALEQLRGQRFDLVAGLFGSPSYVDPVTIKALPDLAAGGLLVLMHYREGYLPDYERDDEELMARTAESREAAASLGGRRYRLNEFVVSVIDCG